MNVLAKPYFLKLGEQDVCRLVSMADVARSSMRPTRTELPRPLDVVGDIACVVPIGQLPHADAG